jgi:uncharacterized hydrophobic protein (TIGR00271 family)
VLTHVRLTLPGDLTPEVRKLLLGHDCVTNVTFHEGASLEPVGDLLEGDVAKEQAGDLLEDLLALGVGRRGGIVLTTPSGTPFAAAERLEATAPGHPDDAVIWESVEAQAAAGSVPTVSFHIFLVLAVALASIAVITDSAVLVVGAMVVGPEFSAVAAASAGIVLRRPRLVWSSLRLLVLSFTVCIAVVSVLALVARVTGLVDASDVTSPRPNTGFIWHPDIWSFIVALLAGAAGALALAIEKTATMVGVFISVTTVPAAGNLALGLAVWETGEILGSLEQLGANIAGMIVSGTLLLAFMRWRWPQVTAFSERLFGSQSAPL